MNVTSGSSATDSREQAAMLLQQLVLSQASRLARAGNFTSAEQLLQELIGAGSGGVAALDLLARIRAQQGALFDAEAFWREVLQRDANHLGARAGLERIRAMHRGTLRLAPFAVSIVALAALAALTIAQRHSSEREKAVAAQQQQILRALAEHKSAGESRLAEVFTALQSLALTQSNAASSQDAVFARVEKRAEPNQLLADLTATRAATSNQLAALRRNIADLNAAVAALPRQPTIVTQGNYIAPAPSPRTPTALPRFTQKISGLSAQTAESELVLTFEDGLFDHDTHLKIGARELLEKAALGLARENSRLSIRAVGYTDDSDRIVFPWSEYKDDHSLALGRAASVVQVLHRLGVFDPTQLHAASSGAAGLPFPSDTPKSRTKNRTVILHVCVVQ
jgi:flagellar motor protein MotB